MTTPSTRRLEPGQPGQGRSKRGRPCFRRPCTRLSPEEIAQLVALRDGGTTWREIGRVFGKQDHACKAIYDKAKASAPTAFDHTPAT